MLLTKDIIIRINNLNSHIYPDYNHGEYIKINARDLSIKSGIKVEVKCDFCGFLKNIPYRKYIVNTKNETVEYSCSNKCSVQKYKKTCIDKYGVDNTYKLKENIEKVKQTCIDKYGVDNVLKLESFKKRVVLTRIKNGNCSGNISEYSKFRNKCRSLTLSKKEELLSNWDGYDYYDGEYIKDNLNLHHLHKNYPTIEHKISILEGYLNNIDINIICDIENLCFSKRTINSSLNSLTYEEKIKKIKYG
jgi:hypothetical protein